MKNNIFYTLLFIFIFLNLNLIAQELEINSSKIKYDDIKKITILEGNINSKDEKGNQLFSEYAEYNKLDQLIQTQGPTKIITSGGFEVLGSNVTFDHKNQKIYSDFKTQITDKDGNKVFVDMFNYSTLTNIFFSKGNIKVLDINNNNYNFTEIYIDEKKKKMIGSDIKAFLNQEDILLNNDNEPRFFANTMTLTKELNTLEKGVFTYCKNRKDEKCPPWVLQSKKIKHDLAKKTIYYENVVLKVYDFPIFFSPRFSHPDPTVKRKSGLLVPTLTTSTSLGSGFSIPYFWNISKDRDLTFSPRMYLNENPLMLAEYRQDFRKSFLIVDTGYTRGYKKTNNGKKTDGGRAHFFSRFNMNFIDEGDSNSSVEINVQKVSNDTYLKIYDVETSLVEKDKDILENTVNYIYQNNDFYLNLRPSAYEDMTKTGNLRHEYLLPLTIEKNIMTSEKLGLIDLKSNLRIRNYETNKQTNFLINDFKWKSNKSLSDSGVESYLEGLVKTVNYKAEKTNKYKNDNSNAELGSALGYFAKLGLYKNDLANKNFHTFTPKFLLRYSPGHMRSVEKARLNYSNLFSLDKLNKIDVVENGLSTSLGFEYRKNNLDAKGNVKEEVFSLSAGQVINAEENMDAPSNSSLDQKFSDVVGEAKYFMNKRINLDYNFSIDQNYKNFNYNEIGTDITFENAKFNLNYLQEKNHIGNAEFLQSGIGYKLNNSTELSFSTKRNLLTSSAEFYNLSYNYINDCLKAGIAYRREFYKDRDIEPENTLMFKISIMPFAEINSPKIN
jgi:LPS-assembly protein